MIPNPSSSSKNGAPVTPAAAGRRFMRPTTPLNMGMTTSFANMPHFQVRQLLQQPGLCSRPSMPGAPFPFHASPAPNAYNAMPINHGTPRGNGFPVNPVLPAYNNGYPVHPGLPPYNPGPSSSQFQQYSMDGSPYPLYHPMPQPWNPRPNTPQQYAPLPFVPPYSTPFDDDAPSSSTAQPNRKRPPTPSGISFAPKRPMDESTTFMIDGEGFDMADYPIIVKMPIPKNLSVSTSDDTPTSSSNASKHVPKAEKGETEPSPSDDEGDDDGSDFIINQDVLDAIFRHPNSKKKSFSPEAMGELKSNIVQMMEDYLNDVLTVTEARFEHENSDEAVEAAGQFNFMMKYYAALDRKARKEKNPAEAEGESSNATAPSTKDPSLSAVDSMQPRTTEAPEPVVEEPVPNIPTVTYKDVDDVIWDDPVLHNTPLGFLVLMMSPNDLAAEIQRLEAEAMKLGLEQLGIV
uniref:Myb-like domain-containing protein n=1 Tax=Panagrellus redivivus TaxID=6233 RepID=A0A7E4W4N4_PANRE